MKVWRTTGRLRALAALTAVGVLMVLPAAATPADGDARWHVVQMAERITQADQDAVVAAGGRWLTYRPERAYVVWLADSAAGALRSAPGVAAVDALPAADKVQADLAGAGVTDALLLTVAPPALADTLAALADAGLDVLARYPSSDGLASVVVRAQLALAGSLASLPGVRYVGPAPGGLVPLDEVGDQIVAGNLSGSTTQPGYEAWLAARGLDGSGVNVAIVDTGVDVHPDFGNRIVGRVSQSDIPVAGEPVDAGGHGTHVAGIVGGNPVNHPGLGRVTDGGGHLLGLGVAPKVGLVDVNAIAITSGSYLCSGGWKPDGGWKALTQGSLAHGAAIWNASWRTCEGAGIGYVDSSRNMDLLVRDGDPDKPGEQPYTMVFAAGNAGGPNQRIEAPSEAKNTIVVAASVNARGGNPAGIATFSSRGPAKDGRVLPTVAAPGETVVSTRSFAGASCNVPYGGSYGLYASCSGTSMASPHVAGSVALVTQWWRKAHGADPSPAMVKALLVNTATDMGARDIPSIHEGWGRVNLGTLFDQAASRVVEDQATVLTEVDESRTYRVVPIDPSRPLRVTVAWTDVAAAAGALPALVNDLDLTVTAPNGEVFTGNRFAAGRSISGMGPDRVNNLENVYLDAPSGEYQVRVSAYDLPMDGAPSVGDGTDQDYALVISNGRLVG